MKWIFSLILMISLQAVAQEKAAETAHNPPAELTAEMPAAATTEPVTAAAAPEDTKNLKETEIPVQLETAKKAGAPESTLLRFLMSFGIIAVLGGAAYFLIRKYRYSNPKAEATQIKILSQHYLGPKKSLAIVRVAGESILIGVTDHNISMIKSLSLLDEDIPEEVPKDFTSVFAKKTRAEAPVEDPENRDEFAISGIRDFVSKRMKNMRSLE